jgi:uncharacterized SAM-binding protein YcdF (DUF218 family)
MSAGFGNEANRRRWWLWLSIVLAVAALLLLFTAIQVERAASEEQIQRADAIVVFGAAEYAGRPSPVYRARLDHAFDLFQRGASPVVITTGGSGRDTHYSEGGVGAEYLMNRGIPERNVIAETLGSDTAQSAQRVGVIMRANGFHSCIAVSDAYHVFRIRALLQREGVTVFVAPRPGSVPHGWLLRFAALLRESSSYLAWRLHLLG